MAIYCYGNKVKYIILGQELPADKVEDGRRELLPRDVNKKYSHNFYFEKIVNYFIKTLNIFCYLN